MVTFSISTTLPDGVYRLLYVERDFKTGDKYLLKIRGGEKFIIFWDKNKVIYPKVMLNQSTFLKSTDKNGQPLFEVITSAY